jgi:RNA polymerase sigma factor (sigma-70 family)
MMSKAGCDAMKELRKSAEHLLRELAPLVLGAVVRRYGNFAPAEDAVQEALLAAEMQWPDEGVPDNPRGRLIHVAARRMTDQLRSEIARCRRETEAQRQEPPGADLAPPLEHAEIGEHDDTLLLLFMCCHPVLTPPSAIALTLRAVGGLTTAEIANAYLVPEATMARRISRAKEKIKHSGVPFAMPTDAETEQRLASVLHVLCLIFNEGYASSIGEKLQRGDLVSEALRLTRAVHTLLPGDGDVAGLLALMLLTDARRAARTGTDGELIPLAKQDRSLWDRALVDEGVALISATLSRGRSDRISSMLRSRPCTTRPCASRTRIGRKSSRSTVCSSGCRTIRWSRGIVRWQSPWCTARSRAWTCSRRSTATRGSRTTTASLPSARTCTRWPARPTRRSPPTARPPGTP